MLFGAEVAGRLVAGLGVWVVFEGVGLGRRREFFGRRCETRRDRAEAEGGLEGAEAFLVEQVCGGVEEGVELFLGGVFGLVEGGRAEAAAVVLAEQRGEV